MAGHIIDGSAVAFGPEKAVSDLLRKDAVMLTHLPAVNARDERLFLFREQRHHLESNMTVAGRPIIRVT